MTLVQWGSLAPDKLAPLYRREEARWRASLDWDTASNWSTIETARRTWGLPGQLCCDNAGLIQGWMFYMPRNAALELGGIVSDVPAATERLLDHLDGEAIGGFVYNTAAGLDDALAKRGIDAEHYAYLVRPTHRLPCPRPGSPVRAWRARDVNATAGLLRASYERRGRLFAPDDEPAQWHDYVEQLLAFSGCGVLRPEMSRVAEIDGHLAAVSLVSVLSATTAHLVQLAVHPASRRRGLARRLLGESLRAAHTAGFAQMSLLASLDNAPACALYRAWGFEGTPRFVALSRPAATRAAADAAGATQAR